MSNRIIILIELLLAVGLFFGYIQPTYSNTITSLNQQITSTKAAQVAAKGYTDKESQLTQHYAQISVTNRARLDSFLPTASNNVHFLYDLSMLASHSGLTLTRFSENNQNTLSKQSKVSGSSLKTSTITLSATGPYQSFRTFLDGIEHSLRIVDVQSINISAQNSFSGQTQKSSSLGYSYKITLKVYWLPNPSSI